MNLDVSLKLFVGSRPILLRAFAVMVGLVANMVLWAWYGGMGLWSY